MERKKDRGRSRERRSKEIAGDGHAKDQHFETAVHSPMLSLAMRHDRALPHAMKKSCILLVKEGRNWLLMPPRAAK